MSSAKLPQVLLVTQRDNHWRYALNTTAQVIQIGRGSHNDITLLEDGLPDLAVRLRQAAGQWVIEPMAQVAPDTIAMTLNQQPLRSPTPMRVGEVLHIGTVTLQLAHAAADGEALVETVFDPAQPGMANTDFAIDVHLPDTQHARIAIQLGSAIWELPLRSGPNTIGRATDADIRLDHPKVSRRHAVLHLNDGVTTLTDADSGNGTWVAGQKITSQQLSGSEAIQIGPAVLVYKPAFAPDELHAPPKPDPASPKARQRKPIVFIPGFMGSQLWQGDSLLWPNLKLLLTRPEALMLPDDPDKPVSVRGLVEDVVVVPGLYKLEQYSQFTEFLKESLGYVAGQDLLEFAYDWRRDLRLAAQQLKTQVEAFRSSLPDPNTKVILIAHSMGCLVTRYFLEVLGGHHMAERVILMGGPHQGTPKIILALLTGKGLLPLNMINDKIRDAVATFPGAYQLLPMYPSVFGPDQQPIDVFADTRWVQETFRAYIADAAKFRAELGMRVRIPTLCIVGYGNKTVNRTTVSVDGEGQWHDLRFTEDSEGDATIPVSSAILEGADFHPVQQSHGALFVDNDVKFRLKLELMK